MGAERIGGWCSRMRMWVRSVVRRGRLEEEMEEEIRFHLASRTEDLVRGGMAERDAARQARVEFGGAASHKSGMRSALGLRWWDDLVADARYGIRILAKSRGFTAIAAGSLALAIGANTSIFSVAEAMLFERLGVAHAENLRMLFHEDDEKTAIHDVWGGYVREDNGNTLSDAFSYPVYRFLREHDHSLGEIFAFKELGNVNVTIGGEAKAMQAQLVSGNFYAGMETAPMLGRGILPSDDGAPGSGAVAVLSYGLWQRSFGGSRSVLGRVIRVNMNPVTVVGVNAKGFTGATSVQRSPELFLPMSFLGRLKPRMGKETLLGSPKVAWVNLMARRPEGGLSDAVAQASLNASFQAAMRATLHFAAGETMPRLRLADGSRGLHLDPEPLKKPISVLLALVGCVLLLACVNVANLMLARAESRQREMSVRLALGCSRSRIFRQMLTEAFLLASLGGGGGLLLGYLWRNVLPRLQQGAWERNQMPVPFHWTVFAFTAGVTLMTGILFGMAPAWRAARVEVNTALKEGGRSATRRKVWSGKTTVALQMALSTLLVAASVLFLRTVRNLNAVNPGFETKGLLLFEILPPEGKYPQWKSIALHRQLEKRLGAVPGVEGVSVTGTALLANHQSSSGFEVEGAEMQDGRPGRNRVTANRDEVGPSFFPVMRIPIVAGRALNEEDTETSMPVSVINETLARRFFRGRNPIGMRFRTGTREVDGKVVSDWKKIVGIAADTKYGDLKNPTPPLHFESYRQNGSLREGEDGPVALWMTYLVRSSLSPERLVPALREAVRSVDPDLPMVDIRTQEQQMAATMQQERAFASLSVSFGVLALVLAAVGIYGVMAYTVAQRTNEIGIRLALGAARGRVRAMVLCEAVWLGAAGVAMGVAVALALAHLVKSMLFGLKPDDPVSMFGASALLLGVALLAAWIPAARASSVDPMAALRHE